MASSLRRTVSLLLACAATLGCGDDATVVTTDATATAATTATATDPSTTAESTSTASTSSGTATQTSSSTGAETSGSTTNDTATESDATTATDTSASTTATTTTTGTDTDTDTEGMEDAEYAARYIAGGLDRIHIRKAEKTSELCTHVGLVFPELDDSYEIATPTGWSVELVAIAEGVAGCLEFEALAPVPVESIAAAGAVTWIDEGFCPTTLDIDVTAEFIAGDLPWVPMKDQLFAEALPIEGCP